MTDISITAASVVAGADAVRQQYTAGVTITAGQAVYLSSSTNKLALADANGASAEIRTPIGIALNGGALNQPIMVQRKGLITIGATLTAGLAYYLSDSPGGICPVGDVGSGEYVCLIGLATTTAILDINIDYTGVSN